jgi:hypothetical protein
MFTPYTPSAIHLIASVFNGLVAPVPVIQLINLLDGMVILALEWPLPFIKDKAFHRAFALRFALYPIMAVAALIQYQCTDPAFYLLIGTAYLPYLSGSCIGSMFKLGQRGRVLGLLECLRDGLCPKSSWAGTCAHLQVHILIIGNSYFGVYCLGIIRK